MPAQGRVPAARVVEARDVFGDGDLDLAAGLPVSAPDRFCLHRLDEAFDGGIVVTIAFPAYRHPVPDTRTPVAAEKPDPCDDLIRPQGLGTG